MSSITRVSPRIPGRIGIFIAIDTTNYYVPVDGAVITSVMTEAAWDAAIEDPAPGISSSLYKDMGKEVAVVNTKGQVVQKFRLAQRVLGEETEGVPDEYDEYDTFYIRTWSADPSSYPVTVSRIG